ncbi:MAG: TolC family protein [Chitinophagaceae bacterium]|nr:TolC family protein [Chitinophagaceae bacterium]
MRRFFLPILLLITLDSIAQKKLTLEEAIATALSNNFDIQLSRNDSIVAALNYGYRNAAFYPRLNANTGVVFNNNDQKQKFTDGTVRERNGVKSNNLTANLALNWTLFDGFRMFATRDKVAELVKLGELGIKEQLVNSVAAVINTYYNIVKQKQQLRAIEEQMSISQERVKLAQYKLDIGVGAKPDVLQSKVDLNAQKAAQLEQQTLIRQLKDQLSQLMNTAETNYDVSDSIPLNKGLVLTDIQSSLDKTNPALQVAQKNILIAGLTLKEIKADRFPVVGFTANYNFNKLDNKAVVNPFQPLNSRNKGFNYGLTATIPIFNNYNVKRQIQQAERDIVFRKLSMDNQKSQISLAVLNAWNNYQWQKQALDLEEESIVLARENVDIVFQVYKLNSTTLIQLKEAQKSLQDAQTRLINARYNTKLAETELLRLKGELVK